MPAPNRPPRHHRPFMLIGMLFVLETLALLLYALPPLSRGMALTSLSVIGITLFLGGWLHLRKNGSLRHATERLFVSSGTDKSEVQAELAGDRSKAINEPAETPAARSAPHATAQIVLITRDDALRQTIVTNLQTWGRSCHVVESCVEATCHLLNQIDQASDAQPSLLIVDTQGLELEPARFASLLRTEARLSHIRLLCLKPRQHAVTAQQLLQAGYTGMIDTPIEKSQLFAAVEGDKQLPRQSDNVIDINRHRQVRCRGRERKEILLAEPNAHERARLQQHLSKAGHRVTGVANGEQALDALELHHFDLAVINLRLPIMNGTQVIKLHRFTTPHRHWVTFITLTDQNTPATLKLCRELQIKACLFKPVPTEELLKFIAASPSREVAVGYSQATQSKAPRFLHADLLDRRFLQGLDQLDNDQGFVAELVEIFVRESKVILQEMQQSIRAGQRSRFVEQCQILLDNAGQLGAFALYEMCLGLTQIDQPAFESSASQRHEQLSELVVQTSQAFHDYLADTQTQQSDLH